MTLADLLGDAAVDIDTDKIDDAVLALLYLTLHDGFRAWKGHDWDVLGRLSRVVLQRLALVADHPREGPVHLSSGD
jgi:hypothetical protein